MIICPLETGEEVIEINDGISPEFIENNTRAGECNNCGDCCFVIDNDERVRCNQLDFDDEGLSFCKLGDERPDGCKDFPTHPDPYFTRCGFYWEEK